MCYAKAVQQKVQVDAGGTRQPRVHSAASRTAGQDSMERSLPSGYARRHYEQAHLLRARSEWSADECEVKVAGHSELKWTAEELMARAHQMNRDVTTLQQRAKLADVPADARKEAWAKLQKQIKAREKKRGVRGLPCFSRLSYFRCDRSLLLPIYARWACKLHKDVCWAGYVLHRAN